MRVPVSWLAEHVELPLRDRDGADPSPPTPDELAEAFVRVGLEIEQVHEPAGVTGPVVVGRVLEITELTEFKKPIRYCRVDVGENEPAGIVCGATNFAVDDLVIVARPGTVLPGDFTIAARTTYGHVSEGMICASDELGLDGDHSGIMVLATDSASPGDCAHELLGLDDTVIELNVTPDRGYCFSVRGLARELACAYDAPYGDPAQVELPPSQGQAWPVRIDDAQGCRRFVARRVTGLNPAAASPPWLTRRLRAAGMRPISLAVDVTNYVMLELGQPLHAFDAAALTGDIVVRRAQAGEKLRTLDGAVRALDPDDLVVCDDTGPLSVAGIMGGQSTEVGAGTTDVLLEAANWEPRAIARAARRHKLPSEAAKRFERSVDPALPPAATELAAILLTRYGGGRIEPGRTDVGRPVLPAPVVMALDLPDRVAGVRYERGATARRLTQIGCAVDVNGAAGTTGLTVTPPTWRPDLVQPADLVEEVLRLEGYDTIPSVLPAAPPGRGLTAGQRRRRAVSRALAEAGYVEVLPQPFTAPSVWDAFGLAADDPRRRTATVLNPLEADRDQLATTLLPGLLDMLARNVSRGRRDVALYGVAQVVLPRSQPTALPTVGVDARPTDAEVSALRAALPVQPVHVGVVLTGDRERSGWWGAARPVSWSDAVRAAHTVAEAAGVTLRVVAADTAPWHPGRCAQLRVGDWPVGHAGELHPAVVERLGLPARTCAMEIDLDALPLDERTPAPVVSPFPPALQDVALVVDAGVPAAEVAETLRAGAGELLDDLRLFDVYSGDQVGEGKRSLAFALRFRAPDRTLTAAEATAARDAAVDAAAQRHGAVLRG